MSKPIHFKISQAVYGIDSLQISGESIGAPIHPGDYFTGVLRAGTGTEDRAVIQVIKRTESGYYLKELDDVRLHDGDELTGRVTRT